MVGTRGTRNSGGGSGPPSSGTRGVGKRRRTEEEATEDPEAAEEEAGEQGGEGQPEGAEPAGQEEGEAGGGAEPEAETETAGQQGGGAAGGPASSSRRGGGGAFAQSEAPAPRDAVDPPTSWSLKAMAKAAASQNPGLAAPGGPPPLLLAVIGSTAALQHCRPHATTVATLDPTPLALPRFTKWLEEYTVPPEGEVVGTAVGAKRVTSAGLAKTATLVLVCATTEFKQAGRPQSEWTERLVGDVFPYVSLVLGRFQAACNLVFEMYAERAWVVRKTVYDEWAARGVHTAAMLAKYQAKQQKADDKVWNASRAMLASVVTKAAATDNGGPVDIWAKAVTAGLGDPPLGARWAAAAGEGFSALLDCAKGTVLGRRSEWAKPILNDTRRWLPFGGYAPAIQEGGSGQQKLRPAVELAQKCILVLERRIAALAEAMDLVAKNEDVGEDWAEDALWGVVTEAAQELATDDGPTDDEGDESGEE